MKILECMTKPYVQSAFLAGAVIIISLSIFLLKPSDFVKENFETLGYGGYGGSQFLANEKMKQLAGKVADTAVNATDQFYQNMQGQAGNMLNLMLQDRTALYNRDTQKMLAEMNKPGFWEELGKGLFGLGSSALGGWASNWGKGGKNG